MMTSNEALERAQRIWGHDCQLEQRVNDRWDVSIKGVWHGLDGNGHVTCHTKCEDLEADLEHQNAATLRDSLRQLLSEAVAILDREDPDHDGIVVQDWLVSARQLLARMRHS